MTRWKKDETDYTVSVTRDRHTQFCRIPKPVFEMLGEPESVTFRIKNNKITVD